MLRIREIVAVLEQVAPLCLQESYDNSGLIVGDPEKLVGKALLCIDSTEAVIDEAIAKGCSLIIAHHPIVFDGLKQFTGSNYVQRVVMKAIRNEIAIYACHTNLDNVLRGGVNQKIAQKLGVLPTGVLRPMPGIIEKLVVYVPIEQSEAVKNALFSAGAGHIGNYDECAFSGLGNGSFRPNEEAHPYTGIAGRRELIQEVRLEVLVPVWLKSQVFSALKQAHPFEEIAHDWLRLQNTHSEFGSGIFGTLSQPLDSEDFLRFIKDSLELKVLKFTPIASKKINTVAICGGAGSFLISDALRAGADAFLTSDIKYHAFFDAEQSMLLCDVGHYESEKYTIELFSTILSEKLPNFATIFSETNTNPIDYLI